MLPRPFGQPRYVRLLCWRINSYVEGSIWYTFQICVVGRTYILQQRSILQVSRKSLLIFSNKTKNFNVHIFRHAFQPTKWLNTGRIPIVRHINHAYKNQDVIKLLFNKVRMDYVYTSLDPNPRLYQAPREIKSLEVQTSSHVLLRYCTKGGLHLEGFDPSGHLIEPRIWALDRS